MSKPNVLILGGVGFIGRNLVQYLVEQGNCAKIRVVDKVLPATAFLGKKHQEAFNNPIVEYMQGNLTSATSITKVFTLADGAKFNYVFNLAGETKYGQTDAVYNEKVYDVSIKCATEAAKVGVDKFIEVSTAQVYDSKKKASKEADKTDPWTLIGKYKLKAEEDLKKIAGLNLVIVRPSVVYGPGDVLGVSPRIITALLLKLSSKKSVKKPMTNISNHGPIFAKKKGINNTPLTPYIDQEFLYNNHLSVDGSEIEKTGFKYEYPELTEALIRDQINYFIEQNLFPVL
ncbi:hypothetical protein DICPUDRAFT_97694 [Dictyostelium purpureum]|uniref:NAD-dependent epimerase/dehydratase domain-containing protein n=1 Tax=Dictyostelium purpureum TaxID=5786 RepID=F0ZJ05_DICPU|nr:uncharacterized protein DICPUDRAFT_97694 [Dictyostelium purpureum]EGC36085.1 hypothetical protein DICPUDRAFT_97694 [Dictyostelium purpureum]|eukprot:XP_003287403.1 hypothetical protein DICPUDRAFT_97694 [Dictyostelium purpureum]